MSLNQNGAQSEKPLGDGNKTEVSKADGILYSLLAILIIVFIWKISSSNSETMDIPEKEISVPHSLLANEVAELNPSIEVEIEEAGVPIAEARPQTTSPKTNVYKSGTTVRKNAPSSYSNTVGKKNTSRLSKSQKSRQNSYQNNIVDTNYSYGDDNYYTKGNYNYIYTREIEMPQGTFRGLDKDGFARTNMVLGSETLSSHSYSGVNLIPIFEDRLGMSKITYQQSGLLSNNIVPQTNKLIVDEIGKVKKGEYVSEAATYEENAYPIQDTLAWHPYESLAYKREEKEIFVAEKVRAMPTADDLEPNIHPSTLGDRDTRMGFGVVIRPNK